VVNHQDQSNDRQRERGQCHPVLSGAKSVLVALTFLAAKEAIRAVTISTSGKDGPSADGCKQYGSPTL
jgi:hypothetical protein